MSIIHEALKKAEQKSKNSAEIDSVKNLSFTANSSPFFKKNLTVGIIAFAGICLVFGLFALPPQTFQINKSVNDLVENVDIPSVVPGKIYPQGESTPGLFSGGLEEDKSQQVVLDQGISFFKNGQFEEAEIQLLKVIESNPKYAEAHNALGLVYKTKGQIELARKHYEEALKIKPEFAGALNNLAVLYEQKGQEDKAIEFFERALSINPNYPEAHLNYALLLEKNGKFDQAKKEYRHFLSNASPDQRDLIKMVRERIEAL